jgi:putative oxidoreductase
LTDQLLAAILATGNDMREGNMIDQKTAPYAITLLRVTMGAFFISHLYYKFYVVPNGLDGWWTNLNNNGYPNWVVIYVLSGEFLGAICLIPGIYARWVALYSMPLIVGAVQYWLVRKGYFFTIAGAELPLLWAIGLVTLAGLGDGAFALVPSPRFPLIHSKHSPMPAE